jgi:DNA-binding NarL/FixJ family response regulator
MLSHPSPNASAAAPLVSVGSASAPIRVLLVDDHPAVRLGVRTLIDDQPDMRVAAEASSARDAIAQLEEPIDVAVVDYHLREGADGLWLTTRLKGIYRPPRVLIYSAFADGALAVTATIAGADGLLGKHELGQELCRAIRRLAAGQHHLPAVTQPLARAMRAQLEPRDQAIFGMLLHGIPHDEIAVALRITPEELLTRRSIMLGSLTRGWTHSGPAAGAGIPLDYERPRRRTSRQAA